MLEPFYERRHSDVRQAAIEALGSVSKVSVTAPLTVSGAMSSTMKSVKSSVTAASLGARL